MRIRSLAIATAFAATTLVSGCVSGFLDMPNYSSSTDAGYQIPAIPITKVPQQYRRTTVIYPADEKPGTIIVDTGEKHLYFILPDGMHNYDLALLLCGALLVGRRWYSTETGPFRAPFLVIVAWALPHIVVGLNRVGAPISPLLILPLLFLA